MYKFKRNIYLEDRTIEMWFGLTSKSRDRHSNFTLYLLTEGPDSPFSYAEQIRVAYTPKVRRNVMPLNMPKTCYINY